MQGIIESPLVQYLNYFTTFPYLLIVIFIFLMIIDTKKGIIALIIIRPIIDCFWSENFGVFGLRITEIVGAMFPSLLFFKILISREHSLSRSPFCVAWTVFFVYQFVGFSIIAEKGGLLTAVNYFLRAFNAYISFFAFQEYFHERDDFKKLLKALIIAGIVPLSMSFYQNVLGYGIRIEPTIAGLWRNIGFYHDAYALRYYTFQTLTALILFYAYFLNKHGAVIKGLFRIAGVFCIFTIYKLYSKSGYAMLAEWAVIWNLFKKRIVLVMLVIAIGAGMLAYSKVEWAETLQDVYSKETGALKGEMATDQAFAGRVGIWKIAINHWLRTPAFGKIFGQGVGKDAGLSAHNDFLRLLIVTGIIGLFFYFTLLIWILLKVIGTYMKTPSPLSCMALMLIVMFLTESMGLTPTAYPGYMLYVWGFIGLALRGVTGLDATVNIPEQESKVPNGPLVSALQHK